MGTHTVVCGFSPFSTSLFSNAHDAVCRVLELQVVEALDVAHLHGVLHHKRPQLDERDPARPRRVGAHLRGEDRLEDVDTAPRTETRRPETRLQIAPLSNAREFNAQWQSSTGGCRRRACRTSDTGRRAHDGGGRLRAAWPMP